MKLKAGDAVLIQDEHALVPGQVVDDGLGEVFVRASSRLQHRMVRVRRHAEVTR